MALGALRISESANLAIHAMAHIAMDDSKRRHRVAEIAAMQGVSAAQLAKVMLRLTRAGLLASRSGPGGGFVLGRPADKIVLLEIYEAIDGVVGDGFCSLSAHCSPDSCALGDLVHQVHEEVRQFLASKRLSELMPARREATDCLPMACARAS